MEQIIKEQCLGSCDNICDVHVLHNKPAMIKILDKCAGRVEVSVDLKVCPKNAWPCDEPGYIIINLCLNNDPLQLLYLNNVDEANAGKTTCQTVKFTSVVIVPRSLCDDDCFQIKFEYLNGKIDPQDKVPREPQDP